MSVTSKRISDLLESEFLSFVTRVYNNDYDTEEQHIDAVLEFKALSEHPSGSDLIFYPEPGKSGPTEVVEEVKAWRAANGKPGFKVV
ncbi:bacteriocin immunity protein [Pseudomonas sp. BW7P1]|uniref:bacteriocin immunity protein n=1 Tax=Pseudomonas TaxID=286 RepID=UPI0021ADA2E3|nr:bacteriocin immunity protein [Pseudomonas sp. BW7P1]UWI61707.1 bacteriocin immunity protein [Pseudomonas sp. BW7P1]